MESELCDNSRQVRDRPLCCADVLPQPDAPEAARRPCKERAGWQPQDTARFGHGVWQGAEKGAKVRRDSCGRHPADPVWIRCATEKGDVNLCNTIAGLVACSNRIALLSSSC